MFNVTGNAIIKRQCELHAATEAKTVDDDNFRKGQGLYAVEQAVNLVDAIACHVCIIIIVKFTYIRTDNK